MKKLLSYTLLGVLLASLASCSNLRSESVTRLEKNITYQALSSSFFIDDYANISKAKFINKEEVFSLLDEIDLISDNYILDVSTSGAEKPIKDFSKFDKYIGKYITVKLRNPVEGNNSYTGTLEEANEDKIKMSYKVKTRTKCVELLKENITKANLAVKF